MPSDQAGPCGMRQIETHFSIIRRPCKRAFAVRPDVALLAALTLFVEAVSRELQRAFGCRIYVTPVAPRRGLTAGAGGELLPYEAC